MSNNKWSEQKIDELLIQAPKLQDTRSKDEVLKRLREDSRLMNEPAPKKRRKIWVPSVVAIAAVLTLSLLTATMLNQPQEEKSQMASDSVEEASMESANDGSSDDAAMTMMKAQETDGAEERAQVTTENESSESVLDSTGDFASAVYPNEISDEVTIFRLGLAGDAANSVPVTFLIPKHQIVSDFGDESPTPLEIYQTYASRIDEEELGFSEYHPYKGSFSVAGDTLIHTLPKNHGYDTASGTFTVYLRTLLETFQGYSQIKFLNENGSIVEFDQVGEPSKPLEISDGINHNNYFLFKQSNGSEYLTPNFGQSFNSLSEALLQMKVKPNDIYQSLIPPDVNFEVEKEDDSTRVIFSKPLDMERMDVKSAMNMLEGMLLTGASFGEPLKLENVVQTNWNGFDFTQPLPIPLGANEVPLILK